MLAPIAHMDTKKYSCNRHGQNFLQHIANKKLSIHKNPTLKNVVFPVFKGSEYFRGNNYKTISRFLHENGIPGSVERGIQVYENIISLLN